jgi:hypothetical protein
MKKEIPQLEFFIKSDIDARELKRAIAVIPIHYEGTLNIG